MSDHPSDPGTWRPSGGSGGGFEEATIDLSAFLPPASPAEAPHDAEPDEALAPVASLFAPVTSPGTADTPGAAPFAPLPPPSGSPLPGPSGPPPQAPPPAPTPEPALFTAAVPPPAPPSAPAQAFATTAEHGRPLPPPPSPMSSSTPTKARPTKPATGKGRQKILLAVLGVVVVGAAVAFLLLRGGGDDEATDTVAPATSASADTAAPGQGKTPAPTAAGGSGIAPAGSGGGTSHSGNGIQTVDLTYPEPKPAMAFLALSSTQSGPFTVTAIAADGTRGATMVEANGPFEGNRMLLPSADGSLPARVEVSAPGPWTLDVRDASTAIQAGVNAGRGSTVLYYRGAGGELGFSHDGPGSFVVRSYQSGQPQDIVSVVGVNQGTAQLPGGPYPIEIVTDGGWLLTAQQ